MAGTDTVSITTDTGHIVSFQPARSDAAVGDRFAAGEAIGTVSTGAHCQESCLHVGVWPKDSDRAYIDPAPFFGQDASVLLPLSRKPAEEPKAPTTRRRGPGRGAGTRTVAFPPRRCVRSRPRPGTCSDAMRRRRSTGSPTPIRRGSVARSRSPIRTVTTTPRSSSSDARVGSRPHRGRPITGGRWRRTSAGASIPSAARASVDAGECTEVRVGASVLGEAGRLSARGVALGVQEVRARGVRAQSVSPQDVGAQGVGAQGVGAQGVGAQGVGAQGVGAQGVSPQARGCACR